MEFADWIGWHEILKSFSNINSLEIIFFGILAVPTVYAMMGAPFVPTHMGQVRRMINAAKDAENNPKSKKSSERHVAYDLGCGDGRLVREAAKVGYEATGYEYSPLVYGLAQIFQTIEKISHKNSDLGKILFRNIWTQKYHDADVIFCYLLPPAMAKFKKEIVPTLKKGTLIVSHAFEVPGIDILKKIPRDGKHAPVLVYKI